MSYFVTLGFTLAHGASGSSISAQWEQSGTFSALMYWYAVHSIAFINGHNPICRRIAFSACSLLLNGHCAFFFAMGIRYAMSIKCQVWKMAKTYTTARNVPKHGWQGAVHVTGR